MKKGKSGGNGMKSMKTPDKFYASKDKAPSKGMPKSGDMHRQGKKK